MTDQDGAHAVTGEPAPPLRSVFFVGSDEPADVERGAEYGADAIVMDLEEPRAPFDESGREQARKVVGDYLRSQPARRPGDPLYFVRAQGIESGATLRDLSAVFCDALAGVLLPKITHPTDVVVLDAFLTHLELEHDRPRGSTYIYPILETAQAVRRAYKIAKASPRVTYMGGALSRYGDIQKALGFNWTPEGTETLFLRSKVLVDVRAAGVRYPISGMWPGRIDDLDGLRGFATELRNIGYYGMLINSVGVGLIPTINEIFSPTQQELDRWLELEELADAAAVTGDKVIQGEPGQGEGHVLHGSQIESARLNLEWARAIARREGRSST